VLLKLSVLGNGIQLVENGPKKRTNAREICGGFLPKIPIFD